MPESFHNMCGCFYSGANKTKLKELESAPPVDEERARLKRKLLDISKKRVKVAKDYTVSFQGFSFLARCLTACAPLATHQSCDCRSSCGHPQRDRVPSGWCKQECPRGSLPAERRTISTCTRRIR